MKRKFKKLTKKQIITALIVLVVVIAPVGTVKQFAEDTGEKLSFLQVLVRALISVVKEIAALLAELLRL